jgi:hypothetical protein
VEPGMLLHRHFTRVTPKFLNELFSRHNAMLRGSAEKSMLAANIVCGTK